jgi:hypothetical protein
MGNSFSHARKQPIEQKNTANGQGEIGRDRPPQSWKPFSGRLRGVKHTSKPPYPAQYALSSFRTRRNSSSPNELLREAHAPARFHRLPAEVPDHGEVDKIWNDGSTLRGVSNSQDDPYSFQHPHLSLRPDFVHSNVNIGPRRAESRYQEDELFPRNPYSGQLWIRERRLERTRQTHAPGILEGSHTFDVPVAEVRHATTEVIPSDEPGRPNIDTSPVSSFASALQNTTVSILSPTDYPRETLSVARPSSYDSLPVPLRTPSPSTQISVIHQSGPPTPGPVESIDDVSQSDDDSAIVAQINVKLHQDLVPEVPESWESDAAPESEEDDSVMFAFIKPYLDFAESRTSATNKLQHRNWEKVARSLRAIPKCFSNYEHQYLSVAYLQDLVNDFKPDNQFNILSYLRQLAIYWQLSQLAQTYFNRYNPILQN